MNPVILGIDVGTATTGWAVIEYTQALTLKAYGVISTTSDTPMPTRLSEIYSDLIEIIEHYQPADMAIESLFFANNQKTVMTVSQARGVMLLAAEQKGLRIYDYTPLQVKSAITGYGKADKQQVQQMVKQILKLDSIPKPDDAADAIAIAICHLHSAHSLYVKG